MKTDYLQTDYLQTDVKNPEAAVVADLALRAAAAEAQVQTVEIGGDDYFLVPDGKRLLALDEFRDHPRRHKGTHPVEDTESFLKLLRYFNGHDIMVKLCKPSLSVQAVLNFPTYSQPHWQDHRVLLKLDKHRDLKAWIEFCASPKSQVQFMEFLEDHLPDITQEGAPSGSPSQSQLQSVIADLNVTTDEKFTSTKDLHNGNYVFHNSSTAKPTVEVPQVFHIAVPIFAGDTERYLIPVRLRYRIKEGLLTFICALANFEVIFDAAWKRVHEAVTGGLPDGVSFLNVPVINND